MPDHGYRATGTQSDEETRAGEESRILGHRLAAKPRQAQRGHLGGGGRASMGGHPHVGFRGLMRFSA